VFRSGTRDSSEKENENENHHHQSINQTINQISGKERISSSSGLELIAG
jgi:hypothetical protein